MDQEAFHSQLQSQVEQALQGDLSKLGWFRNLGPDARQLVTNLFHSPDPAPPTPQEEAIIILAVQATGYELMLGLQSEELLSRLQPSQLWLPHSRS